MMQRLASVPSSQASGLWMAPHFETMMRKVSWSRSSASWAGMRYRQRMRFILGCIFSRRSSREGSATLGGSGKAMRRFSVDWRDPSSLDGRCPAEVHAPHSARAGPPEPLHRIVEAQARVLPAAPQILGEILHQAERHSLHLRGLLEDDQRGDRLAVHVARLEDRYHLLRQAAQLGGAALAGVDVGEVERQKRRIETDLLLDQLTAHLPVQDLGGVEPSE